MRRMENRFHGERMKIINLNGAVQTIVWRINIRKKKYINFGDEKSE